MQRSEAVKLWRCLKPLVIFAAAILTALMLSRVILVIWQWQRVSEADMLGNILIQGLRFDLVLLGISLLIPVVLLPLLTTSRWLMNGWAIFLKIYLPTMLVLITFMECSTPSFINQFDSRPNIFFLEYLNHPMEVGSTLLATQKLPLTLAFLLCGFIAWFSVKTVKRYTPSMQPLHVITALLITPVLLIACSMAIRSTLDHRPVNPSTVALSNDPLANDLALNSSYTALYAAYEMRLEPEGGSSYGEMEEQDILDLVHKEMQIDAHDYISEELPTLHHQQATRRPERPLNLVIILEESLGAEFVGSLGGLDLTPNLDRLAAEGLWFDNLYATGTRSVRGIEAVVTGFTPTPARSIVKLGKSQKNFFTLGELLSQQGYQTSFIYGGEAQFDNMGRFFMNNGFQAVVDQDDYINPIFTGSWGVSDEDLFNRAHEEFSQAGDQPFFSLVFSSSNHSPFEFPDDRIDLKNEEKNTVNNAVRYADYAIGEFIKKARNSNYWENTIFIIVADHNSRVRGAELVPVDYFHIPGLILGGTIEPAVYKPIASQIDLAPTLLSLMGISSTHPMIGHDLTRPDMQHQPGRAIMQYNATQAYMEGNRVAIMRKNMPIAEFTYQDKKLITAPATAPVLAKKALAHANWSSMAYDKKLYRIDQKASETAGTPTTLSSR
jgi:phosphoglycerol transferase MdoB-like AlkP superfamily enzyme